MGRQAHQVYTDPASIRKLESIIDELPANGHVVLLMKDGSSCDGVVSARPNVQLFRDADEHEGVNALVQLQRPDVPEWSRRVWLDQVVRVEHLDSSMASES
ncbi:DUF3247 family protein [Rhodanobacter sp. OK091]|jgi:hypothetical protein|uniref:DUF3247 family protein n=1 Tax=Rhodanobacter sp. OK091 TaxID=1881037 RepID=UPI000913B539|nr:DUF3247 family protein [Rhodanobacter sp. OK091]SHL80306.1 Protein of unknown function [Rhodanobacter sp. OK091]